MIYRNLKVDFEYLGVDYSGIAIEEGIVIKVRETSIDGFPPFTVFENAGPTFPTFNPDGIASSSKHTAPTSGYYLLSYVAP